MTNIKFNNERGFIDTEIFRKVYSKGSRPSFKETLVSSENI